MDQDSNDVAPRAFSRRELWSPSDSYSASELVSESDCIVAAAAEGGMAASGSATDGPTETSVWASGADAGGSNAGGSVAGGSNAGVDVAASETEVTPSAMASEATD